MAELPGGIFVDDLVAQRGTKVCTKCQIEKALSEFAPHSSRDRRGRKRRHLNSRCRECSRDYQRARWKSIRSGTWDRWNHRMACSMDKSPKAIHKPTVKDLYWAAGFLEGEGSFTVSASHSVTARQKQREPLDRVQRLFGGRIVQERKTGIYHWYTTGQRAYGVMLTMFCLLSPRRQGQIITATGRSGRVQGGI